ncbi:MFS general substrate transporter [Atractiella rhizophila]|nr:MFS general substrate transporter [Atractiella rhizophila]
MNEKMDHERKLEEGGEVEHSDPDILQEEETLHSHGAVTSSGKLNDKERKAWKAEEAVLPRNNMLIVFPGLLLGIFLAALDQTIVSVALPTIVKELGGANGYSWVGSSYLLMSATVVCFNGKLSDIIGRKPVLYTSIVIFLLGSALCGAAQSMLWLILCRGVQGIGGGGIMGMTQIIIGDIVSLKDRGKYSGGLGATWGIASIAGPLISGALTDHASWRWCFWINLPTGGIALLVLVIYLNVHPVKNTTWREQAREFDFVGLFLVIAGVVLALIGFNNAENGWDDPLTLAGIVIGFVLMIIFGFWEAVTKRSAIMAPRLFKTRTTSAALATTFIHAFCFFTAAYFIPLYFQILGSSATFSGVEQIPLSVGAALISIVSGLIITKTGDYRFVSWVSWAIQVLGYGLMYLLDESSNRAEKELYIWVAGIGIGSYFVAPLICLQASMPIKDMATSTSAFALVRLLGATMGISIGGAIYASRLDPLLHSIPDYHGPFGVAARNDVTAVKKINPPTLRKEVEHAYTRSIATIWLVCIPFAGAGLLLSFLLKKYSLSRPTRTETREKGKNTTTEASEWDEVACRGLV